MGRVFSTNRSGTRFRLAVVLAVCCLARPLTAQVLQSTDMQGRERPSLATVDETVLLVNGAPYFARLIQHNGESFEFLQSIGFNTIQLPAAATREQLAAARRLGLWLVCPPPASVGLERIAERYDSVLAWSVAENASARDVQTIRALRREIDASDLRTGRPVVANVESHWRSIGELVDIISTGTPTIGSNFPAKAYSDWILSKTIDQMQPFWIDVPTEYSADCLAQVQSMAGREVALPLEPQQLKFLAYEVIAGGGRGIRFLSRSRLDGNDPYTRLRTLTLRWLLRHLDQVEPWVSAGLAQRVPPPDRTDLELNEIRTPDSRLLLIQRPTGLEQVTAGDPPLERLSLSGLTTGVSDQAYLITEAGPELISDQRSATGLRLVIDECPFLCCVLITSNPRVVAEMNRRSARFGNPTTVQMRMSLTEQWLALMQLVQRQLDAQGRGGPLLLGRWQQAATGLDQARRMLAAGNVPLTIGKLNETDTRLASLRRRLLESQTGDGEALSTTPLLSHVVLLPDHWLLADRLANSGWRPNSLTAGDFESLERLTEAGWVNHREQQETTATRVELSRSAAVDGTYGLKLTATARGINPGPAQARPVWIRSAPVVVKAGQWVRIHGWVNIPAAIAGSSHGLTIEDSLGGHELALHVRQTDGWQPFTLYRGVPRAGPVTVTFALTGFGTAMVDEVTIRTLDPPRRTTRLDDQYNGRR